MLVDGRTLAEGEVVETDVCIAGGGPAGLALAAELTRRGLRIALVESGGRERDPAAQELAAAESGDGTFQHLDGSRRRQLGGNANTWPIELGRDERGVRHLPLDEIDFEERDWLPHSGWPFSRADLSPFYARAQGLCGLRPDFDAVAWADDGHPPLPLDPTVVQTAVFQIGPADAFARDRVDELIGSSTARVFVHTTVVGVDSDESATRARALRALRPDGGGVEFRARAFVLAAGGVENARLLLLSTGVRAGGLGNGEDLVGRFFMEHPFVRGGILTPTTSGLFEQTGLYDMRRNGAVARMGHLVLSEDVRRREGLLGVGAVLFPRSRRTSTDALEALRSLRHSPDDPWSLRKPLRHLRELAATLPEVPPVVYARVRRPRLYLTHFSRGGWSEHADAAKRLHHFEVTFVTEQAPDPGNRVTLGERRDRFGLRQARLSTRWGEREQRAVVRTRELLAAELARAGVGELRTEGAEGSVHVSSSTAHHHIGTTRMHRDPRRGVVDENCRVHGLSNLFVAGSSVFPTGGYANPTLTIVALTLRLADHLAEGNP